MTARGLLLLITNTSADQGVQCLAGTTVAAFSLYCGECPNKDSALVIKCDSPVGRLKSGASLLEDESRIMATNGQVLEFRLGDETYCVSIDYVTEIVDVGKLTSVPNSPPHIQGVMDLRGRTTSIVDPKTVFDIDAGADPRRIIVFEPRIVEDQAAAGWLVDEVDQVVQVDYDDVDQSPAADDEAINGVIKQDSGDFVIWVDPGSVHSA
jgi:purine-binding chemotaxis protein CheW